MSVRDAQEDLDRLLDTAGEYARYWDPHVRAVKILIALVGIGVLVVAAELISVGSQLNKVIELLGMVVIK